MDKERAAGSSNGEKSDSSSIAHGSSTRLTKGKARSNATLGMQKNTKDTMGHDGTGWRDGGRRRGQSSVCQTLSCTALFLLLRSLDSSICKRATQSTPRWLPTDRSRECHLVIHEILERPNKFHWAERNSRLENKGEDPVCECRKTYLFPSCLGLPLYACEDPSDYLLARPRNSQWPPPPTTTSTPMRWD